MPEPWTLNELVEEVGARIAQLPPPKNGQVRAVPDDRTVRYYQTIGLLDRPVATRGRASLFGTRHLAQVIAIKRLQAMGRSLAEIQTMWPTLDDATLTRMSGVALDGTASRRAARKDFWKREPVAAPAPASIPVVPEPARSPVELRIELAPDVTLTVSIDDAGFDSADLGAIRDAAAPLLAELARRRRTANDSKERAP